MLREIFVNIRIWIKTRNEFLWANEYLCVEKYDEQMSQAGVFLFKLNIFKKFSKLCLQHQQESSVIDVNDGHKKTTQYAKPALERKRTMEIIRYCWILM